MTQSSQSCSETTVLEEEGSACSTTQQRPGSPQVICYMDPELLNVQRSSGEGHNTLPVVYFM